jgi:hypothetical protein
LVISSLGIGAAAQASVIVPGDLVIYRVGDGTAGVTASTNAAAVFLDEYTPYGGLVQSIALPSTGVASLTAVGNAATEGIITRSQDGSLLSFTGYRKDAGGTSPATDAPATTNRVIGLVDITGVPNAANAVTDPTGNIRSAATVAGANFYIDTSVAVRYVPTPGPAATSTLIDTRNSRQVLLSGNTLYSSNGSTTTLNKVQSYGTLPTGATTPTAVVTLATGDAVNGFVLLDLNPGVAGDDTLYALSTLENLLRKYTFDGTSWLSNGSIPASSAANLTGVASGSTATLYLTSTSSLYAFVDVSGVGGTITGALGPALAVAATNTGFRGIGLIPEPASATILGAAGLLALTRRRRQTK